MTAPARPSAQAAAPVAAIAPRRALLTVPVVPERGTRLAIKQDSRATRNAFAWRRMFRLRCLLGGHSDYLAREPHRLFLRCGECGRCTHGWSIGLDPPRVTAPIARLTDGRATRPGRQQPGLRMLHDHPERVGNAS
jgi:hypothetical protein